MNHIDHHLGRSKREALIDGYHRWASEYVERGWQPYFINLMFKPIGGSDHRKLEVMRDEVERVYSLIVIHAVNNPRSPKWSRLLPVFIGAPDKPVYKEEKEPVSDVVINDGWHFNGVLFVPRGTKLPDDVRKFFRHHQPAFCKPDRFLQRIHATHVKRGTMIDYTMKTFKNGLVPSSEIVILPKAKRELS